MVKKKFWLRTTAIRLIVPVLALSTLSLFIVSLSILIAFQRNIFVEFWLIDALCFVALIYYLFGKKSTLSIIEIADDGITCFWLGKTITKFQWSEIKTVQTKANGWSEPYLRLTTDTRQIDIEMTRKIYHTILVLCPNENITANLKAIKRFQRYN